MCSVVLGGRNKYHWCVGGCSQYMDHPVFAQAQASMCFLGLHCSGSRLLCRETIQSWPWISSTSQVWASQVQVLGYSTRAQTWLGMHFVPCPSPSSSGDQVLGEHTVPGGPWILITSPAGPLSFPGALWEHSLRFAMCLLWGADLRLRPSWPLPAIQDPRKMWLVTGNLLTVWWRMLVSGAEIVAAHCLLALAVARVLLVWGRDLYTAG